MLVWDPELDNRSAIMYPVWQIAHAGPEEASRCDGVADVPNGEFFLRSYSPVCHSERS